MSKNNNNTPRLRFPEFTGEWEEKPLSAFLFEHKTKSDGKCEVHSVSVSKGVINQVEYLGRSFAASDTSKYNLAKPNDIIYTKSPTGDFPYGIVKMNKNPYNVIVSPLYAVYSPINKYVGYILDSYFESSVNTNNYLSSLVQKGAKNTIQITNDTFVCKLMCLPNDEEEQQKIADCLSEMDNLISAQAQKVEALKEKKKGMMQQLLPQKGETTPRLRFPGFTGEWVEKKLGEVAPVIFDGTHQTPHYVNSGVPFYSIENIVSNKPCKFITENEHRINTSKNKTERGDILISRIGTIGFAKIVDWDGEFSTYVSLATIKKSAFINTEYLYAYLQSDYYQKEIRSKSLMNAVPCKINMEDLKKTIVLLPSSPAEQKKIADCLSELDSLIASETKQLEALKDHKKGLMQQLFPQPAK